MRSRTLVACFLLIYTITLAQTRVVHGVLTAYNKYPVANIYELLKGRFPGVTVDGTSGSYRVFIRGTQSISGSNEVLFIVDGSPSAYVGNLYPCEIKSIDVIKDGMTSMYGTRGSNGVILIETKRGD
jgi:TonB-dependent SusC/RagA subfamily outer membrane receptor